MANRKKSNRLKVINGTDQPCRMNPDEIEFDPLDDDQDIPAPDYLGVDAQFEWERIVGELRRKKILSAVDLSALEIMCILFGEVKRLAKAGMEPKGSTITQLRLYQCQFGLTPVSRCGIKASGDDSKENPFNKNGKKPRK